MTAFSALPVYAQAPAAPVSAVAPLSAQELEQLVGRIALYPDDLVTIILPASTNPLQLVQADRFLDQRKANPKAELNPQWDDAVKTLCNYPDVVKMMSQDLDWTTQLGEAVVADTGEVIEAVQSFRRRAQAAGNLKSDDKTKVEVQQETIVIQPADPQVVYVPQYNPATVVVAGGYPAYAYYPTPYPSYYYPYAPGAALATGIIWGAAMGAIWTGGRYGYGGGGNNTINIDRGDRTVNRGDRTNVSGGDRTNVGSGNRGNNAGNNAGNRGQSSEWKSNKKPGQVSSSVGSSNRSRAGDTRPGGSGSALGAGAGGAGGAAGGRTGAAGGAGAGAGARPQPAGGGGGFDGMGSARQTQMDSSRGAASRGTASPSASTRPSGGSAGAGGGGRSSSAAPSRPSGGGGGGARGGGGGGGRGGGGGGRR